MKADIIPPTTTNGEPLAVIRIFRDANRHWYCSVDRPNGVEIGVNQFFSCTYTDPVEAVQEAMDRLNL